MKQEVIIIEGIRYVLQHIVLYCPIINEVKKQKQYGLSLLLNGLDNQKVQILFDSKEDRDKKLLELDNYFGVVDKSTQNVKSINDFLKTEAEKSGYLVDAII
jgi:hypothetical protein